MGVGERGEAGGVRKGEGREAGGVGKGEGRGWRSGKGRGGGVGRVGKGEGEGLEEWEGRGGWQKVGLYQLCIYMVRTIISLAHLHVWRSPTQCWSCVAPQGQGRATSPNCWSRSFQASSDWGKLCSS